MVNAKFENKKLTNKIYKDTIPIINYEIDYPFILLNDYDVANKFSRLIDNYINKSINYLSTYIKDIAVKEYERCLRSNIRFKPLSASTTWTFSYNEGLFLSFYFDTGVNLNTSKFYYNKIPFTARVCNGNKVYLRDLFHANTSYKSLIVKLISFELKKRENVGYFFKNSIVRTREFFREENFYLTPKGIVFFFEPNILANQDLGYVSVLISYKSLKDILKYQL